LRAIDGAFPLAAIGAAVHVEGTLAAVNFRDERGFAIFTAELSDRSRVRALGYLPADVSLRALIRINGAWTRHPRYGWQGQVKMLELLDHLDRRGMVAFLVSYTRHLSRFAPPRQWLGSGTESSN
jgi:hypothetical protein